MFPPSSDCRRSPRWPLPKQRHYPAVSATSATRYCAPNGSFSSSSPLLLYGRTRCHVNKNTSADQEVQARSQDEPLRSRKKQLNKVETRCKQETCGHRPVFIACFCVEKWRQRLASRCGIRGCHASTLESSLESRRGCLRCINLVGEILSVFQNKGDQLPSTTKRDAREFLHRSRGDETNFRLDTEDRCPPTEYISDRGIIRLEEACAGRASISSPPREELSTRFGAQNRVGDCLFILIYVRGCQR